MAHHRPLLLTRLRRTRAALAAALLASGFAARAQDPELLSAFDPDSRAVDAWDALQRAGDATIAATELVVLEGRALLDLPAGATRRFSLELLGERHAVEMRYFQSQLEHRIYTGAIEGLADATIVFGVAPSGVGSAVIDLGERGRYQLAYTGVDDAARGRVHALHRLDPDKAHPHPACGVGPEHSVVGGAGAAVDAGAAPGAVHGAPQALAVATDIDVCVFYTPQAKSAAGGEAAIQNTIATHTGTANAAAVATGVDHNLRLVLTAETQYTETGDMGTDLSRFQGVGDPYMPEVHALRDQNGGDLMSLIVSGGNACGVAYVMCSVSQSFRSSAFSVVGRTCFGQHSYAHEMGHNMGCAHDRANAGCGAFSYSYGAHTPNNQFRSIMAYSPGTRVNKWSGPNVTHNGMPLGSATEDNARSLNGTKDTVASFKPTMVGLNPPTLTAIDPPAVGNYGPLGVQTVTLTGTELQSVTQLTVGSRTPAFAVVDATTIRLQVENGLEIGAHAVVAANGAGPSNALSLQVDPSHPSALEAPFVQLQGTTEDYSAYTDVGWTAAYFFSANKQPSVLAGVVSLGIGAGFSDLVFFAGVPANAGGRADLPITVPAGFGGGVSLHWQVVTYDPANPGLPLEVSNVETVVYL